MKRKKSPYPTRVYTYGCRLPTEGAETVNEQLKLSRVYYNKLLEIELNRRAKVRAAMAEVADVAAAQTVVLDLTKQIESVRTVINTAKAAARSSAVDVRSQRAEIKRLQAERKGAIQALKSAKAESRTPDMLARFKVISEEAKASVKAARATNGLYWGTYLLTENAIEAASKNRIDPEFRRWDGCGRVGVQIQGGLPVPQVFGTDTRFQIDPLPVTGSKRGQTMTTVRIRVGSTENGAPIWAAFPFRMHRPMPTDGVIKWAWIHRTFKGRWTNWDLQIVIEAPSFLVPKRAPHQGGVVAIDLGWRRRPREGVDEQQDLRIGYWYDDKGEHSELRLSAEVQQRLEHANSLRAIQDRNFDRAKQNLISWLKDRSEPLPPLLQKALAHVEQWKSAKRLGGVMDLWAGGTKVDGDEQIFQTLTEWWKQHRHLYDWETCERDRVLNARANSYRNLAATLASRYAIVVVEDMDLSEVAKHPEPEDAKKKPPASGSRVIAAPSEFRNALLSTASLRGCSVVKVDPTNTSKKCHLCGGVRRWENPGELVHTCSSCGATWDRDYNAAINLLGIYSSGEVAPAEMPNAFAEAVAMERPAFESQAATT